MAYGQQKYTSQEIRKLVLDAVDNALLRSDAFGNSLCYYGAQAAFVVTLTLHGRQIEHPVTIKSEGTASTSSPILSGEKSESVMVEGSASAGRESASLPQTSSTTTPELEVAKRDRDRKRMSGVEAGTGTVAAGGRR